MAQQETQSRPASESSSEHAIDLENQERVRIFTKLFTTLALSKSQNLEGAMAAYLDETASIHPFWISCGLSRLVKEPERKFVPSVGEIHFAAACAIRERWGRVNGKVKPGPQSHGAPVIDFERWLAIGREMLPTAISLVRGPPRQLEIEGVIDDAVETIGTKGKP